MRKAIIILCAAVMLAGAASAEAPELRQKLPTEWRHMERIGEGEAGSLEMTGIGWGDKLYGISISNIRWRVGHLDNQFKCNYTKIIAIE